ncbi:hypothetical protein [Nannocystis punicea]|uniref:Lipoprotein n=1 Tax=Nannocystis punicea TaxID=2995304 RepID=A0ABY7H022_9BACT|nr:hypothetical protein [Nannocystis poenicansa]WAS92379.1 hypothetical protein O0S08_39880 [Nannocystis poenicansa]
MTRAWLLGLSLLSACGPEFEPRDGRWEFAVGEIFDDGCGTISDMLSVDFALKANGDGTFTITPDEANGAIPCELSGKEFECPQHVLRAKLSGATVDVTLTEVGSFTSETEGSGRRDARATCSGTQCSLVSAVTKVQFPCTAALEFMVAHAE